MIAEALEAGLRAADKPRGDEEDCHVSDIAFCAHKAWHRRVGAVTHTLKQEERTPQLLMKFAMGNAVEQIVLDAIAPQLAQQGWELLREVRVSLRPSDGRARKLAKGEKPAVDEVVGHLDALLVRKDECAVLEVKSTSFLRGVVPDSPSDWYVVQASTYAVALRAERFAIFVVCRESGKCAEFWYNTADFRDLVLEDAGKMLDLSNPDADPPPAEAQYPWECRSCPVVACANNKSPARQKAVSA